MAVNRLHSGAAVLAAGMLFFAVSAFCSSDSVTMKISPYGYGSVENGEIMKGDYGQLDEAKNGQRNWWMERALLQVGLRADRSDGWSVLLAGEGSMVFPAVQPSEGFSANGFGANYRAQNIWYFHQAEARYSVGQSKGNWPMDSVNKSPLQIDVGFFPVKYDDDARNFGDYLFRIQSYPQYLVTDFDACYTRLLGLRISSTLFSCLRQDVLLTSEAQLWPLRDFSLAYLIDYDIKSGSRKYAEIGAGIMANHTFSVEKYYTSPAQGLIYVSFASTKLMAKASVDFKSFMPQDMANVFGKNDLKLYSELCVNGVDNYYTTLPGLYPLWNNIFNRLPIMIGLNLPAFKMLDVLSAEVEWWHNPYANSIVDALQSYSIFPEPAAITYPWPNGGGQWHWSVYAKKQLAKDISVIGQAARDHTLFPDLATNSTEANQFEDLAAKGDWAWMTKVEFGF